MNYRTLTISSILNKAQIKLKNNGISTFILDAQVLLSKILNLNSQEDLLFQLDTKISLTNYSKYMILLNRRLNYEPIAYIVGSKNFWKHNYIVSKNVLVPRDDTELIIELILKKINPLISNHETNHSDCMRVQETLKKIKVLVYCLIMSALCLSFDIGMN